MPPQINEQLINDLSELGRSLPALKAKVDSDLERYGKITDTTKAECDALGQKSDDLVAKHADLLKTIDAQKGRIDDLERKLNKSAFDQGRAGAPGRTRSPGQVFTSSEAYKEFIAQNAARKSGEVKVYGGQEVKEVRTKEGGLELRAVDTDNPITSGDADSALVVPDRIEGVQEQRRRVRIRDVIPAVTSNTGSVEYYEQDPTLHLVTKLAADVGGTDTQVTLANAAGVKQGSTLYFDEAQTKLGVVSSASDAVDTETGIVKLTAQTGFTATTGDRVHAYDFTFTPEATVFPKAKLSYKLKTVTAKTLGSWVPVTRQILEDAPVLQGFINVDLMRLVELAEELQILYGTGQNQDLTGLWTNANALTYSWSAGTSGDTKIDAIRRAMTLVGLAFFMPTAVMLHPTDLEEIETEKDENGRYINVQIQVSDSGIPRLWRLDVVETSALTAGQALLGDWMMAAKIVDRRGMTLRIADQHADLAAADMLAIIGSKRVALAIQRPNAYVKIAFDSAPA